MMKNSSRIIVLLAIVMWAFMPSGLAGATGTPSVYVNCITGAPPYTPATVAPNTGQEVQAFCNAGDVALGGGYEVLSPPLPLPKGVSVITPENSFYFTDTTPTGWQGVLQNINTAPLCLSNNAKLSYLIQANCLSVQYRVCVSCTTLPPV